MLLLAVLIPATAMAQELNERERNWVFVKDGHGMIIGSINPSPQIALDAIRTEKKWGNQAAWAVLRQMVELRSTVELDDFADDLGKLVLESSSEEIAMNALYILRDAASISHMSGGIIYERGLDVLIKIYEAMDGTEIISDQEVLRTILTAGGEAYVRTLFESKEQPEKPCWLNPKDIVIPDEHEPEKILVPPKEEWCPYKTPWCGIGDLLIKEKVAEIDPAFFYSICDKRRTRVNWTFAREVNGVLIFMKDNYRLTRKFNPTPRIALDALRAENRWGMLAAVAVLRQIVELRSDAELDTFAIELKKLILERPSYDMAVYYTYEALQKATNINPENKGIPYGNGIEVLIELYEARENTENIRTEPVLSAIFNAGGMDYLMHLFESSEQPEKPCFFPSRPIHWDTYHAPPEEEQCPYKTPWCEIGDLLIREGVAGVDPALVYPLCDKRMIKVDAHWKYN